MPMYDYHCPLCQKLFEKLAKYEELVPCPECGGITDRVVQTKSNIIQDEIPGGVWLENYGPDPIQVYSHSERRRLMKFRVDRKGRPYQLTEVGNLDGGCPVTREGLEAARLLVERVGRAPVSGRDQEIADAQFRDPRIKETVGVTTSDFAITAQQYKIPRE